LGLSLATGASLTSVEICPSATLLSLVAMSRSLGVGVLADGRAKSAPVHVDNSFAARGHPASTESQAKMCSRTLVFPCLNRTVKKWTHRAGSSRRLSPSPLPLQIPILEESQGCGLQRQRVGDMAYHCLPASLQLWPSVSHTLLCVLLKRRTQGHQAQKETLLISPPRLCQETWSHERLQQPRSG
jgi:hypothetical protein